MRTIIFRPTNDCNLRCKYCYDAASHVNSCSKTIKEANKKFEKEYDQLLKDFDLIYEDKDHLKLIFHGGEPLLIKPSNIDRLCTDLSNNFDDISYSIQTNGTLINDETIDVFKKHDFKVGLSLDGCNEQQNCQRIFPGGKNSFDAVMSKIKLLKDNDVRLGIIMSIAKQHEGCEQEIYDFIANNDLKVNIRPVFGDSTVDKSTIMTPEEYATFFNNMFDLWFNDEKERVDTNQVTELYDVLKDVLVDNYRKRSCSTSGNCFKNFISLDVDSNLYACNRLYGDPRFYYGNLKKDSIHNIRLNYENLANIRNNLIEGGSCALCDLHDKCHGGCPAEAIRVYGDIGAPSPICKIKKLTREHIKGEVYG
jgi:uncharacterized protein